MLSKQKINTCFWKEEEELHKWGMETTMPLSNRQQSGQTPATIGNQVGVRANRKREVLSASRRRFSHFHSRAATFPRATGAKTLETVWLEITSRYVTQAINCKCGAWSNVRAVTYGTGIGSDDSRIGIFRVIFYDPVRTIFEERHIILFQISTGTQWRVLHILRQLWTRKSPWLTERTRYSVNSCQRRFYFPCTENVFKSK